MGLWVLMPSLLHGGTIQPLDFLSTGQKEAGAVGFKKTLFSCFLKKKKESLGDLY